MIYVFIVACSCLYVIYCTNFFFYSFIFFFKQKTAYEMRISDWSSDVCSSDLTDPYQPIERDWKITRQCLEILWECRHPVYITTKSHRIMRDIDLQIGRASCRERVCQTCRSRWSPYH